MNYPTIAAEPRAPRRQRRAVSIFVVGFIVIAAYAGVRWLSADANPFRLLRDPDQRVADRGVEQIASEWKPEYAAMVLNVAPLTMHLGHRERLFDILRTKTGQSFANEQVDQWYRWLWSQPPADGNALNRLRYEFYKRNPYPYGTLEIFFEHDPPLAIRADEIQWGHLVPASVPPLRAAAIPAAQATYLADGDLVFGLRLHGEARAYPRRILGQRRIVIDTIGGESITAVYCPFCDAMTAFQSRTTDGTLRNFGVSGFLYRSNWLIFDLETRSLWYTLTGAPVMGKAVTSGARLQPCPVVTTTWKEWRTANPDTRTLPLPKLDEEDPLDYYSEGAAFRSYFATDALWQSVPQLDHRLKNKDQVFIPRPGSNHSPVAVSTAFLAAHPVYPLTLDQEKLLIVTSAAGANRAFAVGERSFKAGSTIATLLDDKGVAWTVGEEALTAQGQASLPRLPGHRSFWFAWHAAYPKTALIK